MTSGRAKHRWPIVQGIIALGLGLGLLVGAVLYARANYHSVPQALQRATPARVQPIAGWMTVRYVARTYHVPEPVLLQALGINAGQARFRSLSSVARLRHTSTDEIVAQVRATVQGYRRRAPATPAPNRPAQ